MLFILETHLTLSRRGMQACSEWGKGIMGSISREQACSPSLTRDAAVQVRQGLRVGLGGEFNKYTFSQTV